MSSIELKTEGFYEYGPFRLEPGEHRLTRGGQPVSLPPKAFELLVFLVRNQGRLVTKDQIMQSVWSGSFVEEANLTVSISVLRKALGEKEGGPQYIETVPKKGYRFTASVREGKSSEVSVKQQVDEGALGSGEVRRFEGRGTPFTAAATALHVVDAEDRSLSHKGPVLISPDAALRTSGRHRLLLPVLVIVACLLASIGYMVHRKWTGSTRMPPTAHSLAILPLRNLRQDPDDDFLGFSLADAIITKLGSVNSITVRPSSSIEKYKGQTIDLPRVAADLNVNTLLTGNFIRDGDDLRITYQLIDVEANRILDRGTIDVKYDKLLTVQDNVAQQIITGLQLNLSPEEAEQIKPDEPINPLAYEFYLRGVDLVGSHDFAMAVKMLEKSAAIDPNHALTWAYLGQSYTSAAAFDFGGREQYEKAHAAYERALALQPKQLEARTFLANLLIDTGKVEQAVPLLRDALKSNPNLAAVHWELGYAYRFGGMLKESVAECERARQIDPLVKANGSVLNSYLYLGEYDRFLESLPDVNESAFVLFYRGFGEYHQKVFDRAARDFDRAYDLDPSLYTQIGKAFSDSIAHKDSDGLEILQQLENRIRQRGVGDPEATYKIAQGYAVLGDNASALRMLRYSIENGFFPYPYFITDPLLEGTRGEPGFQQLMKIAQPRYEGFKRRFS